MSNNISPLSILNDGAISDPDIVDGRLIPVVIIDSEKHPEIKNLIDIHSQTPPGDVVTTWGYRKFNERNVYLHIAFSRPVELNFYLKFDLQKQYTLADMIVQSMCLYLQASCYGKSVSEGHGEMKVLIEVPPETKIPNWDKIIKKQISKKVRKDGFSKKQSLAIAKQHILRMRDFTKKTQK